MERLTQQSVLSRFVLAHGDNFDYSRVHYRGLKEKVEIGCKKHHVFFLQTPEAHINGQGCFLCGLDKRKTLVYGVGKNDIYAPTRDAVYVVWREMLGRCYSRRIQKKHPSYADCRVCKEWHTLSNFKAWFENPENGHQDGYHLDKDILFKGNRTYSPHTCCFVPTEINSLFTKNNKKRGLLPLGVKGKDGGFEVSLSKYGKMCYIGFYHDVESAFTAYKQAKEAHIKEIATSYYQQDKITERVYNALMDYKVEITD